jgi:hypothetical protein
MPLISPERHILALPADELEKFARDWAQLKKGYFEVDRFSGAGDMGRDVVGYLTKAKHEGNWHNYQCKQYGKAVPLDIGLRELGKILYFAHKGEFTAPTKYFFVAPKGVARTLRTYISKPSELKKALIIHWDDYCAKGITKKTTIVLTNDLKAFIEALDFSNVSVVSVDAILEDPAGKILMAKRFKEDPAPAPIGIVPGEIEAREMPYVQQLLDAYGERDKCSYPDHGAVKGHNDHGPHLAMQRERFFAADAFTRFYRDNTMSEEIELLQGDIFHGVADVHSAKHDDSLTRANAVMSQAGERSTVWRIISTRARACEARYLPSFRQRRKTQMAEEVTSVEPGGPAPLFNSTLETGVRAVVILDALHPRAFDLAHLTWFDHLVVHTSDIGGPESLHPDIPQRTGELLVRRRLVEDGIRLMRRLHMIETDVGKGGISYRASEDASAFVDALRTEYSSALKQRAIWLSSFVARTTESDLAVLISTRIGRWAVEFQGEAGLPSAL